MNEHIDSLLRDLADEDARHEAPPRVATAVMRKWRSRRLVAHRQPGDQRQQLKWVGLLLSTAAVLIAAIALWPKASVTTTSVGIGQSSAPGVPSPDSRMTAAGSRSGGRELTLPGSNASESGDRLPATRHQPPATAPLVATGHRPQVTSHERRATSHQPPATSYQPYVLVGESTSDATSLSVVRLRMSRSSLATLGLPLPNPDAAALVDVDVFVGEDGVARAIRPVALVSSVSQE